MQATINFLVKATRHIALHGLACVLLLSSQAAVAQKSISQNALITQKKSAELELTKKERDWLSQHKVIRVAVKHNWKPIEFISEGQQYRGITIDYLNTLESLLDVKFEKIDADDFFTSESVDMISSVSNPKSLYGTGYEALNPLFKFPYTIYVHKENSSIKSMDDLRGKRVAVFKYGQLLNMLTSDFPELKLLKVDIAEEAFNALNIKNVDAYIGNEIVVDYEANIQGIKFIKKVGYAPSEAIITMAVRSDWPILKSILNKSIEITRPSQNEILEGWSMSLRQKKDDYILFVLTLLALSAGAMLLRGYNLKKTIKNQAIEAEKLIWHQANFDFLTNLPNRLMFNNKLAQEIKKSAENGLPFGLIFIDLDYFKEINDQYGHAVGDQLLVEVANRISNCTRATDITSRLGGDEFTVILSDLKDLNAIQTTAEKILKSLDSPFEIDGKTIHITSSIGATSYPQDTNDVDGLIKHADQAMYEAKKQGRNRFQFFNKSMQDSATHRLNISNGLKEAITAKQFSLYYQPIIELKTNRIVKAEALIRWLHPEKGIINPNDFIQIAEETGSIQAIGQWVFEQVARDISIFQQRINSHFQIGFNVSPKQFIADSKIQKWPALLKKRGIPESSLIVEITEGILLETNQAVIRILKKLRTSKFQISIDDFGTGYSSLSYLKQFDIDYIKLDRSFIYRLESDNDKMILCQSIIDMAHKLGIKVIAEGIENNAQLKLLREYNCDFGQGYLFSKPKPLEMLLQELN